MNEVSLLIIWHIISSLIVNSAKSRWWHFSGLEKQSYRNLKCPASVNHIVSTFYFYEFDKRSIPPTLYIIWPQDVCFRLSTKGSIIRVLQPYTVHLLLWASSSERIPVKSIIYDSLRRAVQRFRTEFVNDLIIILTTSLHD